MPVSKVDTNWKLRRKFSRYQVEGHFSLTTQKGEVLKGWLRDIGEGGFGGLLTASLAIEQQVAVELAIKDAPSLHIHASVRWYDGVNFGFEFSGLSAQQREQIVRICQNLTMVD